MNKILKLIEEKLKDSIFITRLDDKKNQISIFDFKNPYTALITFNSTNINSLKKELEDFKKKNRFRKLNKWY